MKRETKQSSKHTVPVDRISSNIIQIVVLDPTSLPAPIDAQNGSAPVAHAQHGARVGAFIAAPASTLSASTAAEPTATAATLVSMEPVGGMAIPRVRAGCVGRNSRPACSFLPPVRGAAVLLARPRLLAACVYWPCDPLGQRLLLLAGSLLQRLCCLSETVPVGILDSRI